MARSTLQGDGTAATQSDLEITLGVLAAIEADPAISQRTLSSELGVALGLANAYLKRCVRKGFVKIQQVPRRRYAYYLTPQGFAEKTRLTGEYLTSSLQFFRRARSQIAGIMVECSAKKWRRIALAGATDIAEIAVVTAHDHDVTLVGMIDAEFNKSKFCGLRVVNRLSDLAPVDAVILTRTAAAGELRAVLTEEIGVDRVFVPKFVELSQMRRSARRSNKSEAAGSSERRQQRS